MSIQQRNVSVPGLLAFLMPGAGHRPAESIGEDLKRLWHETLGEPDEKRPDEKLCKLSVFVNDRKP